MVVVDGKGLPLEGALFSASPAEVALAEPTLETVAVPRPGRGRPRKNPTRVIGDKGYDSEALRHRLGARGIELVAPHRCNRTAPRLQDGRPLRRYRKRWKIERTFAWLGNFRRLVVRWDRDLTIYSGFFHLARALIALRYL
ncbi:MAG: transposase [Planctomycetaceae bacterium]